MATLRISHRHGSGEPRSNVVQVALHLDRPKPASAAVAKVGANRRGLHLARFASDISMQVSAAHLSAPRSAADLLEGLKRPGVGALHDLAVGAEAEAGVSAEDLLGAELKVMALQEERPIAL